jgi:HEAT repeat protein
LNSVEKFLRRTPVDESRAAFSVREDPIIPSGPEDEAREPRLQAAEMLGKTAILQNRAKKIHMVQAAARLKAEWAVFFLVGLLGDPIEEIRGLAVRGLIARDDCPIDDVCERLSRPPWFAKSAALQILAAKKIPATARCIRPVIEDPNADVRRSAAAALGEIGGPEARSLLVRLERDPSLPVRTAALAALDKICDFKFT